MRGKNSEASVEFFSLEPVCTTILDLRDAGVGLFGRPS